MLKCIKNGQGYIGISQSFDKSMKELGWDIGTTVYVSWWQKTEPDNGGLVTRSSHIGIYGGGADPWGGSNNSSTGFDGDRNSSRSNAYKNSTANKWEKFSFTFIITDLWNLNNIPELHAYFSDNCAIDFCLNETMYYDNFEVREAYTFIPDVDVRKVKYGNPTSLVPLYKYWDKEVHPNKYLDTVAPLEVQFYFYPRREIDDVFAYKDIMYEEFRTGMFYMVNVDWGDGQKEFTTDPIQLGNDVSLNHSYEEAGIYEITGYMLKVSKNEEYKVSGVLHNKRFVVRININEDLDNEFEYLGGEGFTFLPYKETTPIVGGISQNSIYYKSIKRQLGILDEGNVDVKFKNSGDRLKTELALIQMDEDQKDNLDLLNEFLISHSFSYPPCCDITDPVECGLYCDNCYWASGDGVCYPNGPGFSCDAACRTRT